MFHYNQDMKNKKIQDKTDWKKIFKLGDKIRKGMIKDKQQEEQGFRDKVFSIVSNDWSDDGDKTDQVIELVHSSNLQLLERIEKEVFSNDDDYVGSKVYCNCPCQGPFCDSLMHFCSNPSNHYPQREQAVVDIRNNQKKEQRQKLAAIREEIKNV